MCGGGGTAVNTYKYIHTRTDDSIVPMKIPKTTPSAEPMPADKMVLVAQLFINSSCCIISGVGSSTLRYVRCPGGSLLRSSASFAALSIGLASGTGSDALFSTFGSSEELIFTLLYLGLCS